MKSKIRKIPEYFNQNQRYAWVLLVLILVFLNNKTFPADVITSEDCINKKCSVVLEEPTLSSNEKYFFVNDLFQSSPGEFYRLTFRERSNQDTKINIKIANAIDEEKSIQIMDFERSTQDNFHEIIFSTDKNYSDILFEKSIQDDVSEILISNIRITKLNVGDASEIQDLKKTIYAKSVASVLGEKQTKNDYSFNKLSEPKIIFGEIFRNNLDFITEIELDLDLIKQGDGGGEKFKLTLRKAGLKPTITSRTLSEVKFSLENIEQYRKENGKFKFPIYARVDKDEFYFIGIDNDGVEVNEFNHIQVRGTKDRNSYQNGGAATKKSGITYPAMGDIYFRIFGMIFDEFRDQRILLGSTIEDIGEGRGVFRFQPIKNRMALLDLFEYSGNINFDNDKNTIYGEKEKDQENYFTYYFQTFYSFASIKIRGKKEDPAQSNINLSYSYDNKNWKEIPSENLLTQKTKNGKGIIYQFFESNSIESAPREEIFLKISPEANSNEKEFGIENLEIVADLIMEK